VGADGIMVEVHPDPDRALSDAEQQIDFEHFRQLMAAVVPVHDGVRRLHGDPVVERAASGAGALAKH
jgi:3-deoxy-D-manno-octulosonic acid (KDO) 8-phosphate synthase